MCGSSCVASYPETLRTMLHGVRSRPFTRILVDGALRRPVLQWLDRMNVHAGALFTGPEAVARRSHELLAMESDPTDTLRCKTA
ncbi:MAG TPA: hypothetical protein VES20_10150 [Bryobacteraceae bacterium]|nr:hypothetical protein [Bryobacteraceae bacterium]